MYSPAEILKKYWKFDSFIEPQESIIKAVLSNIDTVALLPTGGGKSVCYQVPALIKEGICIVISPLIALMQDQVTNLEAKGIKSVLLSSQVATNEINIIFDNLTYGNYKFLYLSPEKLQSSFILEKIKHLPVSLISIDEAHCISEWGHDFRPSYLKINCLKTLHPNVPFLALTATATPQVIEDIKVYLELKSPHIFKKSFYRNNLSFHIIHIEDKYSKLMQLLNKVNAPTIVYVRNRKKTKELSLKLNTLGYKSNYYHGGMTFEQKTAALNSWLSEALPIMIATNAFGMGIDKPNVRLIVHLDIPGSIENFMQEAGRGGRDGKESFSVVLVDTSDYVKTEQQLVKSLPTTDLVKEIYYKLNQYFEIPYGAWIQEWMSLNIDQFCERYNFNKNQVYNVLKMLESVEILQLDENINRKSSISFVATNAILFNYIEANKELGALIQLLLRTYGGIIDFKTTIHESFLAKKLGTTLDKLTNLLQNLVKDEIITYTPSNVHIQLYFLVPREDEKSIYLKSKLIKKRNELKLEKLRTIFQFLKNDTLCRNIQLLNYFGETTLSKCKSCDVCVNQAAEPKSVNSEDLDKLIIQHLKINALNLNDLIEHTGLEKKKLTTILQLLIEKDIIRLNLQNKFQLKNEA